MKKINRTIVLLISLLLCIDALLRVLLYFQLISFSISPTIAYFIGVILLLYTGTFIKKRLFISITLFFIGIFILSVLLRILHWPFANLLFITSCVIISFVYMLHFFLKKTKTSLDILKVLWVIGLFAVMIGGIGRARNLEMIKSIEYILFLFLFADFAYRQFKMQKAVGS